MNWIEKLAVQLNRIFGTEQVTDPEMSEAELLERAENIPSMAEQNEMIATLTNQVQTLTDSNAALESNVATLNGTIATMTTTIESLNLQLGSVTSERDLALANANNLTQNVNTLTAELNAVKTVGIKSVGEKGLETSTKPKTKEPIQIDWSGKGSATKSKYFN